MSFQRAPRPQRDRSDEFASVALERRPARMATGPAALTPDPKPVILRSREYLRWVGGLACCHCKRPGPSQAAHADEGKGERIKSGDNTAHPLCADRPGRAGCHTLIGSSGTFSRDQRRQLERAYGAATKRRAILAGAWPEAWPEQEVS